MKLKKGKTDLWDLLLRQWPMRTTVAATKRWNSRVPVCTRGKGQLLRIVHEVSPHTISKTLQVEYLVRISFILESSCSSICLLSTVNSAWLINSLRLGCVFWMFFLCISTYILSNDFSFSNFRVLQKYEKERRVLLDGCRKKNIASELNFWNLGWRDYILAEI